MRGWRIWIYLAYWWVRVRQPNAHLLPVASQPLAVRRYKALTQPSGEWLAELRAQPLPPRSASQESTRQRSAPRQEPPRRDTGARPRPAPPGAPDRGTEPPVPARRPPSQRRRGPELPPPTDLSLTSRHVTVNLWRSGLTIRRRAGYTRWIDVCALSWDDITALEFDSGVHDAARMLYASTRGNPMREPLIDQAHLADEQWLEVKDSVARWTRGRVEIDVTRLNVIRRTRPYDEL